LLHRVHEALQSASPSEAQLDKAFLKWWPDLESKLNAIPPSEDQIEILSPERDQVLSDPQPWGYPVSGRLTRLPSDQHEIWLLVSYEGIVKCYPQTCPVEYNSQTGVWKGRINPAGESPLWIIAVVAPPTSQAFFGYYKRRGDELRERVQNFGLEHPEKTLLIEAYAPLDRVPPECTNMDTVQVRLTVVK
jgi:hypothetical protein